MNFMFKLGSHFQSHFILLYKPRYSKIWEIWYQKQVWSQAFQGRALYFTEELWWLSQPKRNTDGSYPPGYLFVWLANCCNLHCFLFIWIFCFILGCTFFLPLLSFTSFKLYFFFFSFWFFVFIPVNLEMFKMSVLLFRNLYR